MSTMFSMDDADPTGGLWNWAVGERLGADLVHEALAGALDCSVTPLGEPGGDVLCDVYEVGGDFPTLVDVYLAPVGLAEPTAASAVAVRLGADVLLADDSLDPSRFLLADPTGGLTTVHADEIETDDGPQRRHVHPCAGPACGSCRRTRPAAA